MGLDDEQLVVLANSYSLRSSMERVEMDDDVCDSVDAIVVDQERYEERMKSKNYGPVELFPPKHVSVKDLGETLDSTGLRSSMFRGRASMRQPQASTATDGSRPSRPTARYPSGAGR